MKRARWAIVASFLCVAAAILWWRNGSEDERADELVGPLIRQSAAENGYTVLNPAPPQSPRADSPAFARIPDYSAQFRAAPDYLEYVRSLLDAARAGDHAAQFYIFRAFDACNDEYHSYFFLRGVRATLDDALKRAADRGWPFDPEDVRRAYNRCFGLMESGAKEFGDRNAWLRLASDGGYPLAQVFFARYEATEAWRTNSDDASGREARKLLLAKAVRSRNPEVIFEIGAGPYVTVPLDGEPAWDSNAWMLAGCLRGLDCSPQSEITRMLCIYDRACQPYESVADILRRANETEFPGIEDEARAINEKIDAGDWEALGF